MDKFAHSQDIQIGSERSFGLVFAVFFLLIGLIPISSGEAIRVWSLGLALLLLLVSFLLPKILVLPNVLWFKFGLTLGKVMSPLVLGLLYFAVFTPVGLLLCLLKKDLLKLRFEADKKSYWIERDEHYPMGSMKNQF